MSDDLLEKRIREAISAFQKGIDKERNFQFLVEQFYGRVLRFLSRWTSSEQDRLDITQEVFLRVFKGLKDYRGDAQFGTWLFRIAYNTFMRWSRRGVPGRSGNDPHPAREEELEEDGLAIWGASLLGDQLGELIAREKSALLRKAIADLPNQMRRCVELHVYQDLRYHEIATALRLSTGTVKAQLFQAREKLRNSLSGTLAGENL